MRLFFALRQRSFALLWSGQTSSRLGDGIYQIAVTLLIVQHTKSPLVLGLILFCSVAPLALFALVGGAISDRFSRIQVMMTSDLLRGGLVGCLTALAATNHLGLGALLGATVFFGSVDAFFQPAYTAVIPDLLPSAALTSANSLTSLSQDLLGIVAPGLGALVVATGGTAWAFGIDALSFFISASCLILLASSRPSGAPPASASWLHDVREGVRLVRTTPWLWVGIGLAMIFTITNAGSFFVIIPFLVRASFPQNGGVLGVVYGLAACGSSVAAIIVGQFTRLRQRGWWMYGLGSVGGLLYASLGLPISPLLFLLASFLLGIPTAFELIWTNSLQDLVPRQQLGRVSSIDLLATRTTLPVGYLIVGATTARFGAGTIMIACGLITTATCLLGLLHPRVRTVD